MRFPLPLLFAAALASPAAAATLKPYASVTGAVVRLSDLWDGVGNDKPLGPAPEPGGRFTVAAPQLSAIARQFGVDWRSDGASDRVIVERPGRALTQDDLKPALRAALTDAGVAADADLDIGVLTAPLLPQTPEPHIAVAQLDYDHLSGRFSALIGITTPDSSAIQFRISGRAQEMVDLPVVRQRIMPGTSITPADLTWTHVPLSQSRGDVAHTPADIVGLAAKRTIAPNLPIALSAVGRSAIVQKGQTMTLTLEVPGLQLTSRAVATEPGGFGEHIRVFDAHSRVTFEVEITGPLQGRVIPNTAQPALNRIFAGQ